MAIGPMAEHKIHPNCICYDIAGLRLSSPIVVVLSFSTISYLVDPASSHMLVSKIKPCMSKYKPH